MSDNELRAFMTLMITSAITIGILAQAWARSRSSRLPRRESPEMEARLARMERAIDSIAVEVERISEAQRFLTKVLADPQRAETLPRPASPPPPTHRALGTTTPV